MGTHARERVHQRDNSGDPVLLGCIIHGWWRTALCLVEEYGAALDGHHSCNDQGQTVWDFPALNGIHHTPTAMLALLQSMLLRCAPAPNATVLKDAKLQGVLEQGMWLRSRAPEYVAQRREYLNLRCPRISKLPGVLRGLIFAFEGPSTTQELWNMPLSVEDL
jgi:hypothetical protein